MAKQKQSTKEGAMEVMDQLAKKLQIFWPLLLLFVLAPYAWPASFYTRRLEDPRAVYVTPSGGDDTARLQKAIDQVQETTGQGIVLLATGQYRVSDTLYIWPSIRLIGYGDKRPVIACQPMRRVSGMRRKRRS